MVDCFETGLLKPWAHLCVSVRARVYALCVYVFLCARVCVPPYAHTPTHEQCMTFFVGFTGEAGFESGTAPSATSSDGATLIFFFTIDCMVLTASGGHKNRCGKYSRRVVPSGESRSKLACTSHQKVAGEVSVALKPLYFGAVSMIKRGAFEPVAGIDFELYAFRCLLYEAEE